jgi:uncharacterized protein YbjT (DUF2867 family)
LDVRRRHPVPFPQVAVRDLGNVIAELLTHPQRGHQVIKFTGPAEWSPAEIAQAMGEVTGKSIRVPQWPASTAAQALAQFGVPPSVAALLQEMYEGLDYEHISLERPQTVRRGQTSAKSASASMWHATGTGV